MLNAQTLLGRIRENIERVFVGKRNVIDLVLIAVMCKGHVLIEDVPGIGKTTLVMALANSLGCTFQRIQFTPDLMPSDVTGFSIMDFKTGEFKFKPGAVMSQIVLADEINRTSPKTQAALLEVMQEGQVTVDGTTYPCPQPFMVLATQNPIDYIGTYPLPEAQIDRFLLKITLGYPTFEEEIGILYRFTESEFVNVNAVASAEDIIRLQKSLTAIHCSRPIYEYVTHIVERTRVDPTLSLGISPRGAIGLILASKAQALLCGRDFVIPEDVRAMIYPVLGHRAILKPEAKMKRISVYDVLGQAVSEIPVPGSR